MTDPRPRLSAPMLISRDGLEDLEVAISSRYEALDGTVEDVEAVWQITKHINVDRTMILNGKSRIVRLTQAFIAGDTVDLTPAEEQQAEQLLFETLPERRAERIRRDR